MTLILALGHRKKMGKDTLARFMTTELRTKSRKLNVENRSFAFKLKSVAHSLYQWAGLNGPEYYDLYDEAKDRVLPLLGKTPRDIWIEVGQKMREIDNDIWINSVLRNAEPNVIIVRDLRFPHEIEKIKELRGKCIKVIRKDFPLTDDKADCALDDFNGWDDIVEASNLPELNSCAIKLVEKYCRNLMAGGN